MMPAMMPDTKPIPGGWARCILAGHGAIPPAVMGQIISLFVATAATAAASTWTCDDPTGSLARTLAPVAVDIRLGENEVTAAQQGRLGMVEVGTNPSAPRRVAVQWQTISARAKSQGVCLLPPGPMGPRRFELRAEDPAFASLVQATQDVASGQVEITADGKPVLRYNYRTVEPGAVLAKVTPDNLIYARARSDYIHPLYGLKGEVLTRDWSVDHPHHRGIYWAWPEVDFGNERGDLHALQRVFARPTGKLKLQSGPVFAQVEAENQWLWNDHEPIVRELATIRAYRATAQGRVVDLTFQFTALKDGVSIARRGTDKYGGLNVRLETPKAQVISFFTSPSNAVPRRAWSDLCGQFPGASGPSGVMVLQGAQNPDYPGDWVQYPELSWCQPTFPAAGTRFTLRRGSPLELRFRLLIHPGTGLEEALASPTWDAFNASIAPQTTFEIPEIKPAHEPAAP